MKTIYFLCTGNSCRSQIAEGFGKSICRTGQSILLVLKRMESIQKRLKR